jgi:transitional endoplasmic reticulum ATPase
LDSALLRPGRFDDKIYVDLPDMESKIFIINSELKDMPLSKGISVKDIAKKMHNYNAADIVEFVHKLKIAALKRSIKEKSKEIISLNDVEDTFKTCASSVKKEDIESMNNFRKNN